MAEAPSAFASGTFTAGTVGARGTASVADAVTNSTVLLTSATASFQTTDVGRVVAGGATIGASSADLGVFNYIASRASTTNVNLAVAETGSHSAQTVNFAPEYVLSAVNVVGAFYLELDLNAMAAGDVVEFRIYNAVLTGGTPRLNYPVARYNGVQTTDPVKFSPIIANDLTDAFAVVFTCAQMFGTARAIPWKVLQL